MRWFSANCNIPLRERERGTRSRPDPVGSSTSATAGASTGSACQHGRGRRPHRPPYARGRAVAHWLAGARHGEVDGVPENNDPPSASLQGDEPYLSEVTAERSGAFP